MVHQTFMLHSLRLYGVRCINVIHTSLHQIEHLWYSSCPCTPPSTESSSVPTLFPTPMVSPLVLPIWFVHYLLHFLGLTVPDFEMSWALWCHSSQHQESVLRFLTQNGRNHEHLQCLLPFVGQLRLLTHVLGSRIYHWGAETGPICKNTKEFKNV